jgi:hypothetical protein
MLKFRKFIKLSPPFEGGVAGTLDYLIFTRLISRPGWLIYYFFTFISMKTKTSSTEKVSNLPDHLSVTGPLRLRQNYGTFKKQKIVTPVNTINHPGRKQTLQSFDYHCIAAAPPSKGGET